MRSIEYYIILTADGMYADPDGGLDHYDPADDEHRYANELLRDRGRRGHGPCDVRRDVVLGPARRRRSRHARGWRRVRSLLARDAEARRVARHPQLGPNATKLEGDVVEAVRALKSSDGPPIAVGAGADLFATLAEAGLIDRYRWLVIPKAIGQGKRLFSSLTRPLDLRLVGTRTFDSGAVLLEYEPNERRPSIS